MQNNESFIQSLMKDLNVIKVEKSPFIRVLPWTLGLILYMVIVILWLIGLRFDFDQVISSPLFHLELFLALFTGFSCMIAASYLRVPYTQSQKFWIFLASLATLLHSSYLAYRLTSEGFSLENLAHYKHCFLHAITLSTIPAIILVTMSKNASVTHPLLSALFSTLAIASFAWFGLRVTCPLDMAEHNALVQVAPFIVLGLILGKGAKNFFNW